MNHPIRYVYLIGVVVDIQHHSGLVILTIDDGSGALIEVKVRGPLNDKAQRALRYWGKDFASAQRSDALSGDQETKKEAYSLSELLSKNEPALVEERVPTLHPTNIPDLIVRRGREEELLLANALIQPGSVLKVKGTVSVYRANLQLSLLRVFMVSSTAEEVAAWADYADFAMKVLCRPWVLEPAEIKELEAADKARHREERERVSREKVKAEDRKRRKLQWEEKVKRHQERAERRRVKEAKVLDGQPLDSGLHRTSAH